MNLRQAAQQALDELVTNGCEWAIKEKTVHLLRAALAEPEQEPVALDWLHKWANQDDGEPETRWHEGYEAARRVVQIHLSAPPQRQPLTDEEIEVLAKKHNGIYYDCDITFARAIEAAHGIKEHEHE